MFYFSIIDSALNPSTNLLPEISDSLCEDFATYFNEKISMIRSQMPLSTCMPLEVLICSSTWTVFEPVSFDSLVEIVSTLKTTSCFQDVIPTKFFKPVLCAIGSDLLSFINKYLCTGVVPNSLKHALVLPKLKRSSLAIFRKSDFEPTPVFFN